MVAEAPNMNLSAKLEYFAKIQGRYDRAGRLHKTAGSALADPRFHRMELPRLPMVSLASRLDAPRQANLSQFPKPLMSCLCLLSGL